MVIRVVTDISDECKKDKWSWLKGAHGQRMAVEDLRLRV